LSKYTNYLFTKLNLFNKITEISCLSVIFKFFYVPNFFPTMAQGKHPWPGPRRRGLSAGYHAVVDPRHGWPSSIADGKAASRRDGLAAMAAGDEGEAMLLARMPHDLLEPHVPSLGSGHTGWACPLTQRTPAWAHGGRMQQKGKAQRAGSTRATVVKQAIAKVVRVERRLASVCAPGSKMESLLRAWPLPELG
jgi:hypothetical protein